MGTRQKFQVIALCGLLLAGLGCQPPGARAMFEGEARLKAGEAKQAVAQFEQAVALGPDERVWVLDSGNDRLYALRRELFVGAGAR